MGHTARPGRRAHHPRADPGRRGEELIAKEGYDPVYGARPLKRAIQRVIQDPLAVQILKRTFGEGDSP